MLTGSCSIGIKMKTDSDKKSLAIKKRAQRIVWLAVLTLVTSLVWIALNSYRQLTEKEKAATVEKFTDSLDPKLDVTVLSEIETKKEYKVEDVEIKLVPSPVSTESSSLVVEELEKESSPSAEATSSGGTE